MEHTIREISINDADAYIALLKDIYDESSYMLYSPGEYVPSLSSALQQLEHFITSPSNTIYLAEIDGKLIGFAVVTSREYERTRHETRVRLGIRAQYRSKGVGQSLLNAVDAWAYNHDIRRLEALVVPQNEHAVDLFKSAGYQIEGEMRDKLKIDNKYYSEYVMAKLLH
ncbi:GNAT family N-acetyltransferase [Staphylococcus simulans]|uniref:GNAT family N-acetyltransferase n=1 Tax=Staphylococcus simulans TaxID=1286 RepID=UPI000E69F715|nr:GNAT family N-acetyltransferase [Staphylococcus simulans]RIN79812.1 GNAT family N-acetyltransferase [Staphylococcus simulans]